MKSSPESEPFPAAEKLARVRHSLAHIMAQAVLELRPGAKLGFGPPIEDGFYYDFLLPQPLTELDFEAIEQRMRRIIAGAQRFEHEELEREPALARLGQMGEPYKREYAEELFAKKQLRTLSFYRSGPFLDMCDGPHVRDTSEIPADAFKLRALSGAYWRGNEQNVMMTRLYAWAFADRAALEAAVAAHEQAKLRDHKRLGRELEIFVFDDEVGKGLPLWLPNGTVIRDELEKLMKELEFEAGFQRVATPHLAKAELYERTGHLPYYAGSSFPLLEVHDVERALKEVFCLKPMNCPHHHKIFASKKRSYRELPVRLAEYGQCYRYEDSGALSGLLRVRGMCMNDAHIYCSEEQVQGELAAVIAMHRRVYAILGLENWRVRLSTHDPRPEARAKFVADPQGWSTAERLLREALVAADLPFEEVAGEAAFYAPKIDFQFRSVLGREETASTLQLDFGMGRKLGLTYVGRDGREHHPYIIHRAPLGTHERFVALLLEHYGGAFPTWLAPVQVRALPVSDQFEPYAQRVVQALRQVQVRAELDASNEGLGKRVRLAVSSKIPNVVVVGRREQESGSVSLRCYGSSEQKSISCEDFVGGLQNAIRTREGYHPTYVGG